MDCKFGLFSSHCSWGNCSYNSCVVLCLASAALSSGEATRAHEIGLLFARIPRKKLMSIAPWLARSRTLALDKQSVLVSCP